MTGRHRKPPQYTVFFHYAGWTLFWVLLVALGVLIFYMTKELL
ncbi:hypothetical protein GCM10010149_88900 [Nonomuraea roseoviolacea subsp. roseoviolacea]